MVSKKGSYFELIGYLDANFAGSKIDRKSKSGIYQFLGNSLISWFSKKQTSITLSTAKPKYISAESCCAQILRIKYQMEDYGIKFSYIPIRCNSTSAIQLTKNPILHSRTKYIEIKYHFIRGHVKEGNIDLEYVNTNNQLAHIFTKPLGED